MAVARDRAGVPTPSPVVASRAEQKQKCRTRSNKMHSASNAATLLQRRGQTPVDSVHAIISTNMCTQMDAPGGCWLHPRSIRQTQQQTAPEGLTTPCLSIRAWVAPSPNHQELSCRNTGRAYARTGGVCITKIPHRVSQMFPHPAPVCPALDKIMDDDPNTQHALARNCIHTDNRGPMLPKELSDRIDDAASLIYALGLTT